VTEQLVARDRLRIHHVRLDRLARPAQRLAQHAPQHGLAGARRSHHHHAHPLPQLLVDLQRLLQLNAVEGELVLGEHLRQRLLQLVVLELADSHVGEDVLEQGVKALRVAERQL